MIKLPDFILIPYQLLEDKKISLIDERLYGIIYWLTKLKNEKCTASNKTLAELVKTTSGTIQNSLTKLEELEYIKRFFKDENRKIRKEIIPLVVFSKVSFKDDRVSPTDDKVSPSNDTHLKEVKILNKSYLPTDNQEYHSLEVSPTSEQNKNNKKSKEDIVASDTIPLFSFKEELRKIMEGKRKDSKIIALYFIKKGLIFKNKEQFNANLVEELRNAKKLIGYSKEELEKIMEFCAKDSIKNEYEWKLSTVVKKSAIIINKI